MCCLSLSIWPPRCRLKAESGTRELAVLTFRGASREPRSSMQAVLSRLAIVGQITATYSVPHVNQPFLLLPRLSSHAVFPNATKHFSSSKSNSGLKILHTQAIFSPLRLCVAPRNALTLHRTAGWWRQAGGFLSRVCRFSTIPLSVSGKTICRQPDVRWQCYRYLSLVPRQSVTRHQAVRQFNSQAWLNRRER